MCVSEKLHVHHEVCCVFQKSCMFMINKSVVCFRKITCSSRRLLYVSAKLYADEEACCVFRNVHVHFLGLFGVSEKFHVYHEVSCVF